MLDKIIGAILGFAVCKALGILQSSGGFSGLFTSTGPSHPAATPVASHHNGVTSPALPPTGIQMTSTAAPFPVAVPSGLPPWPSGWKPARTTQDIILRAQVLLKSLPTPGSAIELASDGRWIRYQKGKQGAKTMVTAWEPKQAVTTSASPFAAAPPTSMTVPVSNATPAAAPGMPPVLKRGMKGAPVRDLQQLLAIPADGDFGPGTERAVKAFQKSKGLKPDGIVGPSTWSAMRGSYQAA